MTEQYQVALGQFRDHLDAVIYESDSPPPDFKTLEDLIRHWVEEGYDGGGAKDCAHDYNFFMAVVVLIIEVWAQEQQSDLPDSDRIAPRKINKIFSEESTKEILNPLWFKWWAVNPAFPGR